MSAPDLPDLAAIPTGAITAEVLRLASAKDLAKGADCIMFAARILQHGGRPDRNTPPDWPHTLGPWTTPTNPRTAFALAVAYVAAASQKESTR